MARPPHRVGPDLSIIDNNTNGVGASSLSEESSAPTAALTVSMPETAGEFHVHMSKPAFVLFWVSMLLLHTMCMLYFVAVAYLYLFMKTRSIGSNLVRYAIRMELNDFKAIAYVHVAIAVPHGYCVLRMLFYSIYYRQFVFDSPYGSIFNSSGLSISSRLASVVTIHRKSRFNAAISKVSVLRNSLFGQRGLFGVAGEHFHAVFLCQEAIQISFQSYQAYNICMRLSKPWFNRIYVILLVGSCWSTYLIQVFSKKDPPLERLLVFMVGLLLDMVALVVIPTALVRPYFAMYSPARGDFYGSYWYDDAWLVQMMNEAQIILVRSALDLCGRVVFSTALISAFMVVKSLVQQRDHSVTPVPADPAVTDHTLMLKPSMVTSNAKHTLAHPANSPKRGTINRKLEFRAKALHWMNWIFMVWGVIVLCVHIHSESHKSLSQCRMQVRPWLQSKTTCSLLAIDCNDLQLLGTKEELVDIFDAVNEPMIAHIVFRHCTHLEMPPNLRNFKRLVGFKVYNSTIAMWEQDAGLTNAHHPRLTFLFLIRVNMTEIPLGLRTDDFPKRLSDIETSVTNLSSLPDDLDKKWPKSMVFVLEKAQFTAIPDVLVRMEVAYLGLVDNKITQVPVELFTHTRARSLWLSGNPLTLPSAVPSISGLFRLRMVATNMSVATLPTWIPTTFLPSGTLYAGNTSLCKTIKSLQSAGNDMTSLGSSLANTYKKITCTSVKGDDYTYYPLLLESRNDVIA